MAIVEEPEIERCSFCGTPNTLRKTLIAGPGVSICEDCVSLCAQIVEGHRDASLPRVAPWEHQEDLEALLCALPGIAMAASRADRHLGEWVRKARSLGATWARIGAALGITRQSVWERFSGRE